ncbi:MAG: hypothetical protein LUD51_05920 [Clostridia bacterium]|nr:hypothetical protein [Clostridia bacterium]
MPKKEKRQYITDTRSQSGLQYMLHISPDGVFSRIPLDHVGFDDDVLELLANHRIMTIGQILKCSPASLRKKRYLAGYVIGMMDALDAYFCRAFEEGKKAYQNNPVPIYRLIGLKDIDRYRNYLLYDFKQSRNNYSVDGDALRAHGIITLYDFLKMNLIEYHKYGRYEDSTLRSMLMNLHSDLDIITRRMLPMSYPLNEPEIQVISYPLPAREAYKVSSLTDDRIAGDEVSTAGLTVYEKALYDRSAEAIADCGADFYYDVLDNREAFEKLAECLAAFCPAALELMQRKEMLRSLYMAVPERFRQMPARALYHYKMPRNRNGFKSSPYSMYVGTAREPSFFRNWELFHSTGRMLSLEDAYRHMERMAEACRTIEDFDWLLENDGDWEFLDLLHWVGNVSMLTAVYDTFLRDTEEDGHEAPDEMKAIADGTDPDDVISRLSKMKRSKKADPGGPFQYYSPLRGTNCYIYFLPYRRYASYRYDFFAVYMLLSGKDSVPFDLVRRVLYPDDAEKVKNFLGGELLYEYHPDTDTVDMKPHALEQ